MSGVLVHVLSHQMSEADEELSSFWYPMIWPSCEVEVAHQTSFCCFHLLKINIVK